MDITLMLAGGYWGQARKIYKEVDPDMDRENRGVDYVIKIKGLPEYFLPAEEKKIVKYFCETCKKQVPEWEVENKVGCFALHKCSQEIKAEKSYPGYLYSPIDSERAKKKKFLSDGMILWVNNPEGAKIAERIFKYVQSRIPSDEIMPSPVPLGTKNGYLIESADEIPCVDVSATFEEIKTEMEESKDYIKCPHCDQMVLKKKVSLRMHIMGKHREIFEQKYQGTNKIDEVLGADNGIPDSAEGSK